MNRVTISGVVRQPWVGDRYRQANPGLRLLIVGESHHHNGPTKDREDLTRNLIKCVLNGSRISFYTKVAQLFGESPTAFYQHVAFYNYLQEVMEGPRVSVDDSRRKDPTDSLLFIKVLQKIQPERVLVLGKTNWRYLPSSHPEDKAHSLCTESDLPLQLRGTLDPCEKNAYWYRTSPGKWALVGAIAHPSSAGFSSREWRGWINSFMEYRGDPPATA